MSNVIVGAVYVLAAVAFWVAAIAIADASLWLYLLFAFAPIPFMWMGFDKFREAVDQARENRKNQESLIDLLHEMRQQDELTPEIMKRLLIQSEGFFIMLDVAIARGEDWRRILGFFIQVVEARQKGLTEIRIG